MPGSEQLVQGSFEMLLEEQNEEIDATEAATSPSSVESMIADPTEITYSEFQALMKLGLIESVTKGVNLTDETEIIVFIKPLMPSERKQRVSVHKDRMVTSIYYVDHQDRRHDLLVRNARGERAERIYSLWVGI